MKGKLNARQLALILLVTSAVNKIYVLPAVLTAFVKQSAPITILVNFAIDFLLLLVVLYIAKNDTGKDFYNLSSTLVGKGTTKCVFFIYFVYFVLKAVIPILEQKNSINLTFYESQPTLLTFLPFYFVAFYIALKGANAFGRSIEIMVWLLGVAYLITFALSVPSGKYADLLPIISANASGVVKGISSALIWFGDPVCILFLYSQLDSVKTLKKKTVISHLTCTVLTVALVAVFYAVFGPISERQYFAPLKMSKYSITLSNIGRFDYFGAMIFSLISVFSLSLPIMLASRCLDKVFCIKNRYVSPIIVCVVEVIITFVFQNGIFILVSAFSSFVIYFFIACAYALPLIYALILYIKQKQGYTAVKGGTNVQKG